MNEQELRRAAWNSLKSVPYPGEERSIVALGLVERIDVEDRRVTVRLRVGHLPAEVQEEVIRRAQQALAALPDDIIVRVEPAPPTPPAQRVTTESARPPGVARVLAVGSGKGGVGKSSVAVNLAVALAQRGYRVGLLDADVYGPNTPRMLGVAELPPRRQRGRIPPAEAYGVRFISVGFMVKPDQAVVWRGPMTDKLVRQFLADVEWGELDLLVVDLPPGTGDVAIALTRHARPDGALLVTTPQAVAWDDVLKAAAMFRRLGVPVVGYVENMAYFECPNCGARTDLFPRRPEAEAQGEGLECLARLPFDPAVVRGSDEGKPAAADPTSPAGQAFRELAERVAERLGVPRF